jgi:predicted alpha/beta-hydrolase family hydrolase
VSKIVMNCTVLVVKRVKSGGHQLKRDTCMSLLHVAAFLRSAEEVVHGLAQRLQTGKT